MTNKTDNDELIYKLRSEGWADAADALQAAQEENNFLKLKYKACMDLAHELGDYQSKAETKLAAIRHEFDTRQPLINYESMRSLVYRVKEILNTTNTQPAQEQGGKE